MTASADADPGAGRQPPDSAVGPVPDRRRTEIRTVPRQPRQLIRCFRRKGSPFYQLQFVASPRVLELLRAVLDEQRDQFRRLNITMDARGRVTLVTKFRTLRPALALAHAMEAFIGDAIATEQVEAFLNARLGRVGQVRQTVAEYLTRFSASELADEAAGKLTHKTVTRYAQQRGYFTTWLATLPGHQSAPMMSEISLRHCQTFLEWMTSAPTNRGGRHGYDAQTRKSTRSYLSAIWKRAQRDEVARVNPWTDPSLRIVIPKRDRLLIPDNLIAAIAAMPPTWETDALLLLLYTCSRQSDLVTLTRDDIVAWPTRAADGTISEFGELRMRQTKTGGTKVIPMVEQVDPILRRQLARHESPWVFARLDRATGLWKPMSSAYMVKRLNRLLDKIAGTKLFSPHALRRTGVTTMLDAGVPLDIVRRIAGHLDEDMTWRYAQQNRERRQDAARKLSQRFKLHTI